MSRLNINEHPIGDNLIMQNNHQVELLGAERVAVGVRNNMNGVDGKIVYDLSSQQHKNWFVLDFETGGRGWFPGSRTMCTVVGDSSSVVNIKADEDLESETVAQVYGGTDLEIITIISPNTIKWYYVKYNDIFGYLQSTYVTNIRYI